MPATALSLAPDRSGPRAFLGVERSVCGRPWRDRLDERATARALAIVQRHGVPELLARILAGRGVEIDAVDAFLDPSIRRLMPDPHVVTGMEAAASRIAAGAHGPAMAFDTFISYASKDKPAADAACAVLERAGISCWIAPRDIKPGGEYGEAIIEAIDQCRVMVLIFSSSANDSRQVHREIERAVSKGVPIIPLRIEEVLPTKSMEYFLGAIHWLGALTPPFEKHLQQLAEAVRALLQIDVAGRPAPLRENTSQASTKVQHARPAMQRDGTAAWSAGARRLVLLLLGVAAACIGLLIGGVWLYLTREPAAVIAPAQAVAVHAASVKDIFQKYNLIGTFAQDCSKPPTVQTPPNGTPQNWWFVNRLIDDNHAERDFMNSPTERAFIIMTTPRNCRQTRSGSPGCGTGPSASTTFGTSTRTGR